MNINSIIKEYNDLLTINLKINVKKELLLQLLFKLDALEKLNIIEKVSRKDTIILIQYTLKILDYVY